MAIGLNSFQALAGDGRLVPESTVAVVVFVQCPMTGPRSRLRACAGFTLVLIGAPLAATLGHAAFPAPPTQRTPVSVPFEIANRLIIVNARVNGSGPLSFVLDTGANQAIVRLDVAKRLGLTLEGTVNAGGAGAGTQVGSRVRNASWSLDGHNSFVQPVTIALPLPRISAGIGRDIAGIIGGEFVRQFVVELDYQSRTITLHDRNSFTYRGPGETLPLDFTPGNHPVVRASINAAGGKRLEGRFMLDTGSSGSIVLHSPWVVEHRLLDERSKTISAAGAGAGGRTTGRIGRVGALQLGSFALKEPLTMFSEDTAGAFADRSLAGNLGAQIAQRFRLFLDYGRKRLILEPSAIFAEPFDRAFTGIVLRAEGADFRTFRVQEVFEQSVAADAGIREGDIIASMDGTPSADLTLTAINEMLAKPVLCKLTILRGQDTVVIELTPRQLP
jgi:predicted aspartyl protease